MSSRCTLILALFALSMGCGGNPTELVEADTATPNLSFSIDDSDGTTLIDAADIKSYDWETHTISLRKGLRDQLSTQLAGDLVGGSPFAVITNGKTSYDGHFTTSLSSNSLDSIVINLHPLSDLKEDQIQITLGYPDAEYFTGDDLRKNQSVKDTLESLGKLQERK